MEENIKKMLYDNVENPWEFVIKAASRYKQEFIKTSKIGKPPAIDEVMGAYVRELTEGGPKTPPDEPGVSKDAVEEKEPAAVKDA